MSVARDRSRLNRKEKGFTATTQVVNSTEPPGADPHARWCGRGAVSRPPIPILGYTHAGEVGPAGCLFLVFDHLSLSLGYSLSSGAAF